MKKEDVLNEILKETLDTVKKVKNLSIAEAPELAKEVIREAKAQLFLGVGFGLLLELVALVTVLTKPVVEQTSFGSVPTIWLLPFGLGLIVGSVVLLGNVPELISVYAAPKMYVLRKLANVIKGKE